MRQCEVTLTLSWPRLTPPADPVKVPSPYPIGSPNSVPVPYKGHGLSVFPVNTGKQTPKATLTLSTPSVTAPGTDITLSVSVTGCASPPLGAVETSGAPQDCGVLQEDARVFVVAVDKAWLDLKAASAIATGTLSRAGEPSAQSLALGSCFSDFLDADAAARLSLVRVSFSICFA